MRASSPARGSRTSRAPTMKFLVAAAILSGTGFAPRALHAQAAGALAECAPLPQVYPDSVWEIVDVAECAGWSSAGLDSVRTLLSTMSTTGMVAIVGGRKLMEYGDLTLVSYLASVRKSVLSMLYGIHVDRGVIDLNETLAQLGIDDIGGLTDAEKQATVRHLLSARSGVYHQASNPGDNLADAPPRGSQLPGEYFLYSNWDFNALGTIFEQETGRNIYDALEEHLARPLGMRDFDRSIHRRTGDTTRSVHLAYHMHLSTRDMARIGYLMLRNGEWNGARIVPEAWVGESTRLVTRRRRDESRRAARWRARVRLSLVGLRRRRATRCVSGRVHGSGRLWPANPRHAASRPRRRAQDAARRGPPRLS